MIAVKRLTYAVALTLFATISSNGGEGWVRETVVIPKASFTLDTLVHVAKSRLPAKASWHVLVVDYVESEPLALAGVTHESFSGWVQRRKQALRNRQCAQLVATSRGAVLRLRRSDQTVHQEVIGGDDPLSLDDPARARVLAIDFSLRRAFVVVEHATPIIAQKAAQAVFDVLPSDEYEVFIREDEWFVPDLNPDFGFLSARQPPSLEEWQKAPSLWCGVKGTSTKCRPLIYRAGLK